MRIPGISLDGLDDRVDEFVALCLKASQRVATRAAKSLPGTSAAHVSLDDLNVVPVLWAAELDKTILPAALGFFLSASDRQADLIRRAQKEAAGLVAAVIAPEPGDFADYTIASESDAAQTYLAGARNRLVGIGDETWSAARTELVNGMQLGESVPKLAKRVSASAGVGSKRATMIARTEVIGASNAGSIATMRQLGQVAKKEWLATGGPRTRPTHQSANGQIVGLEEQFAVGGASLDHPGDPTGPAREVINCRCTMTYDLAEDAAPTVQQPVQMPPVEEALTNDIEHGPLAGKSFNDIELAKSEDQSAKTLDDINPTAAWRGGMKRSYHDMAIPKIPKDSSELNHAQRTSIQDHVVTPNAPYYTEAEKAAVTDLGWDLPGEVKPGGVTTIDLSNAQLDAGEMPDWAKALLDSVPAEAPTSASDAKEVWEELSQALDDWTGSKTSEAYHELQDQEYAAYAKYKEAEAVEVAVDSGVQPLSADELLKGVDWGPEPVPLKPGEAGYHTVPPIAPQNVKKVSGLRISLRDAKEEQASLKTATDQLRDEMQKHPPISAEYKALEAEYMPKWQALQAANEAVDDLDLQLHQLVPKSQAEIDAIAAQQAKAAAAAKAQQELTDKLKAALAKPKLTAAEKKAAKAATDSAKLAAQNAELAAENAELAASNAQLKAQLAEAQAAANPTTAKAATTARAQSRVAKQQAVRARYDAAIAEDSELAAMANEIEALTTEYNEARETAFAGKQAMDLASEADKDRAMRAWLPLHDRANELERNLINMNRDLDSRIARRGLRGMASGVERSPYWADRKFTLPTPAARAPAVRYSGTSYEPWNQAIREFERQNIDITKTDSQWAKPTQKLDDLIAQGELPTDTILHRGTGVNEFQYPAGMFVQGGNDESMMSLVGSVQTQGAYLSTSIGEKAAFSTRAVQIEFMAPAGTKATWMGAYSKIKEEREVLLGRNTRYFIHDVQWVEEEYNSYWRVLAEILPD